MPADNRKLLSRPIVKSYSIVVCRKEAKQGLCNGRGEPVKKYGPCKVAPTTPNRTVRLISHLQLFLSQPMHQRRRQLRCCCDSAHRCDWPFGAVIRWAITSPSIMIQLDVSAALTTGGGRLRKDLRLLEAEFAAEIILLMLQWDVDR